ncbi:hypothetical protein [Lacrimispora sp.]|uniref:hypothetical protein n=1 Tax=Lacrimispora sp. TaxID=2719234 RepID=UPI0028A851C8|nr:hypothetical protein [Lacrimispora sp.]
MNDLINPNFQTDVHCNDKPLNVNEIKKLVDKTEPYIRSKFKNKGFIASKDYSFITYANFDDLKNCGMDEKFYPEIIKNDEEKKVSSENLDYIKNYFQLKIPNRKIEVNFYARSSIECALVDSNRFSEEEIQQMLCDYFS